MAGQHRANGGPSFGDTTMNADADSAACAGLTDLYDGHPSAPGYPMPDQILEEARLRAMEYRELGLDHPGKLRPYRWSRNQLADWLAEHHPPSNPTYPCRCGAVFCEYRQKVAFVDWAQRPGSLCSAN